MSDFNAEQVMFQLPNFGTEVNRGVTFKKQQRPPRYRNQNNSTGKTDKRSSKDSIQSESGSSLESSPNHMKECIMDYQILRKKINQRVLITQKKLFKNEEQQLDPTPKYHDEESFSPVVRKYSASKNMKQMTQFQLQKEELKEQLLNPKQQSEEKEQLRMRKEGFFFLRKLIRRLKGNDNIQIDEVSDEEFLNIFDDPTIEENS